MQLIQVRAKLLCGHSGSVCHKIPFIGGILHGTMERLISTHAPQGLITKLGICQHSGHAVKCYRLLPPEYNSHRSLAIKEQEYSLTFGILLYELDANEAYNVAHILEQYWQALTLGAYKDTVLQVTTLVLPIDLHSQQFSQPTKTVTLQFQSPLQLKTMSSKHCKERHITSPPLLALIRSIKNKALAAVPKEALTLGCHKVFDQQSNEWIAAEEAIRPVLSTTPHLERVSWRYGSCSKDRNIQFSGAIGTLEFQGKLPDPIYTLLQWGTWLGVGEKSTFGQGMYLLKDC